MFCDSSRGGHPYFTCGVYLKMDVGVVIGRFQVDELHEGHKALISHASSHHPNLVIFIGVAPLEGTKNNPLSYQLREQMIRTHHPTATVLPLYDVFDDQRWSDNLDAAIKKLFYGSTVTMYCGLDGFKPHYHGEFEVIAEDYQLVVHRGTDIRTKIGQSADHQASFRAGIIHQTQKPYVNVKMCVDIAATKNGHVLLGHKEGEIGPNVGKLWRFPGGQVDYDDTNLEGAAQRELYEETGLTCEGKLAYLDSFLVGDWRNHGTGLSTFTALFVAYNPLGCAKARDDIDEIKWWPIDRETANVITSEHGPLYFALLDAYGTHQFEEAYCVNELDKEKTDEPDPAN